MFLDLQHLSERLLVEIAEADEHAAEPHPDVGRGHHDHQTVIEEQTDLVAVGADRELAALAPDREQKEEIGNADVSQLPHKRHAESSRVHRPKPPLTRTVSDPICWPVSPT